MSERIANDKPLSGRTYGKDPMPFGFGEPDVQDNADKAEKISFVPVAQIPSITAMGKTKYQYLLDGLADIPEKHALTAVVRGKAVGYIKKMLLKYKPPHTCIGRKDPKLAKDMVRIYIWKK